MPNHSLPTESLFNRPEETLAEADLHFDEATRQNYARDWSRPDSGIAAAVAFPRTTKQVQALVKWANQHRIALVPSGGRTGLSGGANASAHEVVVSLEKMRQIHQFNPVNDTVSVEAGVITQELQNFAHQQQRFYPVDFASSGSSQIGGNIATNAGGIKVIRYGLTRDWVAGLTVVTGTGDILRLNQGLEKNATGYDLRHLFIGSEGTLGIITEAIIKLSPTPPTQSVMLLGLSGLEQVGEVMQRFKTAVTLSAFEFFSQAALEHVIAEHSITHPFDEPTPWYTLLEFDGEDDSVLDLAMVCFEELLEDGLVVDGVISQSEQQAAELWRCREWISESISKFRPYKNDIAVKPSDVTAFLRQVDQVVAREYPDFTIIWFGHIGDGNLHLNILKPEPMPLADFQAKCHQISPMIFAIVQAFGGSISAEHGVGTLKKPFLGFSRSDAEIGYLKAIKHSFDPNGIMNPGKLLDNSSSSDGKHQ